MNFHDPHQQNKKFLIPKSYRISHCFERERERKKSVPKIFVTLLADNSPQTPEETPAHAYVCTCRKRGRWPRLIYRHDLHPEVWKKRPAKLSRKARYPQHRNQTLVKLRWNNYPRLRVTEYVRRFGFPSSHGIFRSERARAIVPGAFDSLRLLGHVWSAGVTIRKRVSVSSPFKNRGGGFLRDRAWVKEPLPGP